MKVTFEAWDWSSYWFGIATPIVALIAVAVVAAIAQAARKK
jgi:hypothetical protein